MRAQFSARKAGPFPFPIPQPRTKVSHYSPHSPSQVFVNNYKAEEEFRQDFTDFDLNKDNMVDVQEVRSHFKNEVSEEELAQFWVDVDADNSGTLTWPEYREYAKAQYADPVPHEL